jgi:hypothetical protein
LLTKIAQLCNEICNIDKTIKMNNIKRLPESTINTNRNKNSVDVQGTDDPYEKGCNNSSRSSPIPHESDLSYSTNKPPANEEHPTQKVPILIPCVLS